MELEYRGRAHSQLITPTTSLQQFFKVICAQRIETFTLYLSLAFLSEDSFVMLRYIETQINASKGEFGFLDVYRFNPQAADSTPPIHTASFTLPPLPLADLYRISVSIAHLACAPTNSSGIFPKVFVPAPQRRLLRLDAPTMDSLVWFDRSSYRSLLIPSVVLLNAAYIGQEHDTDPLVVPWADWATQTSWVDIAELGNTQGTPWFTQRMAGIHLGTPVTKPELVIFDFDQHRVKNSSMSDSQSIWQVCTPGNNPTGVINTVDEDAVFQNSEDLARKKFVKAVLPVEMEMDEYDSVMTDEEHGECMHPLQTFFNDLLIVTMFLVIIRMVCSMSYSMEYHI